MPSGSVSASVNSVLMSAPGDCPGLKSLQSCTVTSIRLFPWPSSTVKCAAPKVSSPPVSARFSPSGSSVAAVTRIRSRAGAVNAIFGWCTPPPVPPGTAIAASTGAQRRSVTTAVSCAGVNGGSCRVSW